jgi:F420-non-reducing hydrogenase iron-sulfur subunit
MSEAKVETLLEKEFEPKIIGFFCNWCAYSASDLAGISRISYPSNIRIIRVMCSGRVNIPLVLGAFVKGADGVLVAGCHPGDCHYIKGNLWTRRRVTLVKLFLDAIGIGSERLRLEWIGASEGQKVADTVSNFIQTIKELGPNPLKGE